MGDYNKVVEKTMNDFINKLQTSSLTNVVDYESLFLNYLKKYIKIYIQGVDYKLTRHLNRANLRLSVTPEKEIKVKFLNMTVSDYIIDNVYGDITYRHNRTSLMLEELNKVFAESTWFIHNVELGYDIESTIKNLTNSINNFNFK